MLTDYYCWSYSKYPQKKGVLERFLPAESSLKDVSNWEILISTIFRLIR